MRSAGGSAVMVGCGDVNDQDFDTLLGHDQPYSSAWADAAMYHDYLNRGQDAYVKPTQ